MCQDETMSRDSPGIRDVAAAAGVSVTTVSDALNNKGRISEETRGKVRQVAHDLGYRPSSLARGLRTNRSHLLGVVVTKYGQTAWDFTRLPYFTMAIDAAMTASLDRGYALTVLPADRDAEFILSLPLDGLLVLDPLLNDPLVRAARQQGVTVVADRANTGNVEEAWIDFNHGSAVSSMCDRLAAAGDRSPALLTSDGNDSYTAQCLTAYRRWCKARGKTELVIQAPQDMAETRSIVSSLLNKTSPPDEIFGLEDYHATTLVEEVQKSSLQCPNDIVLGCFTEFTVIPAHWPPIVRLTVSPSVMGANGIELLVDVIEGRPLRKKLCLVPNALLS